MTMTKGPNSRLRPALAEAVLKVLSGGAYVETACEYTGLPKRTYHYWVKRGNDEINRAMADGIEDAEDIVADALETAETYTKMARKVPKGFNPAEWPFVAFAASTERARAGSELRALVSIQTAGQKDWRAQAWFLEHTRMDRYQMRQTIGLEGGKPGTPIETKSTVSVDALEQKLNELMGHSEDNTD